eukprot:440770_1
MSTTSHTNHITQYNRLDDKQREAVCADIVPIWVNAGPGAGKTRVIVERIKYLILNLNIPIKNIVALTFTNKAAQEMQERIMELLKNHNNNNSNNNNNCIYSKVQCETFHAFCFKILKQYGKYINIKENFNILTNPQPIITQILKQNKEILHFLQEEHLNSDKIPIKKILNIISEAKRHIKNAKEFEESVNNKNYNEIKNCNNTNDMFK